MVLIKINDDGKLEANWEELSQLAKAYDLGLRTEEAYHSKLVLLILEHGYDNAVSELKNSHERMMLLLSCAAGSA